MTGNQIRTATSQKVVRMRSLFYPSLLAFLMAYLLLHVFAGIAKYMVIRAHNGMISFNSFTVECISPADSGIWSYYAVYEIYGVGFVTAILVFAIAYLLFKKTDSDRLFTRFFLIWLTALSLHSALGIIPSNVLLQREFFYLFQWAYLSTTMALIVSFIIFLIYLLILRTLFMDFMQLAPSDYINESIRAKRRFFFDNVLKVAVAGFFILFAVSFFAIRGFEILDALFLIVPLYLASMLASDQYIDVPPKQPRPKTGIKHVLPVIALFISWAALRLMG